MAEGGKTNQLSVFQNKSGTYRFENSSTVFIDPVRVLNQSYTRFKVSPSAYYYRFFEAGNSTADLSRVPKNSVKRERKEKKPQPLNEREQIANQRHQEARFLLLKAHEALLGNVDLVETLRHLRSDQPSGGTSVEQSFVELGSVWQAPLYEITLNFRQDGNRNQVSQNESDLGQIHDLIPAESDCGFNLIVVDPPWENSSAHQKLNNKVIQKEH